MKLKYPLMLAMAQCLAGFASGAIVIVAPTDAANGSLEITEDIVFTSLSNAGFTRIVLRGLSATDGASNATSVSPNLAYIFDGSADSIGSTFSDARQNNFSDLLIGDAQFTLSMGISFTDPGEEFTLLSGVYTLNAVAGFNPASTGTFTGEMFLANTSGVRTSNIVTVPEPGGASLLLLGAGIALIRRR